MKKRTKLYELIIVGGGPAGVAGALHAKTILSNILLIEKGLIGGKVNEITLADSSDKATLVGGQKLGLRMKKQLAEAGLVVGKLEVISVRKEGKLFLVRSRGRSRPLYSQAVVIATGSSWKKLELAERGSSNPGAFSYRVLSDAHLARGKVVLVVGGGYAGCQVAAFLANFAEKVHLVHRGGQLAVDPRLESRILNNKKVEVHLNSIPLETSSGKKLESCTIISVDKQHKQKLAVSMIFPCIGTMANQGLVSGVVAATATGNISVNDNFQTSTEGLFAVGDVTGKKQSQISSAAKDGRQAVAAALSYLQRNLGALPAARKLCTGRSERSSEQEPALD